MRRMMQLVTHVAKHHFDLIQQAYPLNPYILARGKTVYESRRLRRVVVDALPSLLLLSANDCY